MSVQFGIWNWEGRPPAQEYVAKISATLAPYGPDSNDLYSKSGTTILYRAFHTTKESHREKQPHICSSGAVITWDGRLDNRVELISELSSLSIASTDVEIVAAAYERWETGCFAKLIGDWAVSIWNPDNRSLILSKDPIGTRHLYYSASKDQVTWSTVLDPLVLFANRTFAVCEEYIAGWFYYQYPGAHLTPYVGIHHVPPSSSVFIQFGSRTTSKYWDFDTVKTIRYRSNAEYEEHFRAVFAKAVQRRLRSDHPVLAELSGGMDSSSIVCMADLVIARGDTETSRLDTVSYYDDSDPEWSEEPFYFAKVEAKRRRTGHHVDLSASAKKHQQERGCGSQKITCCEFQSDRFVATPDSNRICDEIFGDYIAYLRSHGYRVTLSGIAGEEATGGFVPTPRPEVQDLLARGRFFTLAHQLNAWAIKMRKPRLPLLWEATRGFFPLSLLHPPKHLHSVPWLHSDFVARNRAALLGYPRRVKLLGPLPSLQDHMHGLGRVRRAMASYLGGHQLHLELLRDVRYPYLDRDLLEFMYAIPREQIVGVGKRRFLMKRALAGIVPDDILNRRQRAAIKTDATKDLSRECPSSAEMGDHLVSSCVGIIDANRFSQVLERARRNEKVDIDSLKRTLLLEFWLRHLTRQRVLSNSIATTKQQCPLSFGVQGLRRRA